MIQPEKQPFSQKIISSGRLFLMIVGLLLLTSLTSQAVQQIRDPAMVKGQRKTAASSTNELTSPLTAGVGFASASQLIAETSPPSEPDSQQSGIDHQNDKKVTGVNLPKLQTAASKQVVDSERDTGKSKPEPKTSVSTLD